MKRNMHTYMIIFSISFVVLWSAGFRYNYRRGINNLLVLLIGGIPIAMPTVLSVTLAIGAKQLSEHKAIVTHVTAIEELAAVTILCSDKTGTLTLNKLVVDILTWNRFGLPYIYVFLLDGIIKKIIYFISYRHRVHILAQLFCYLRIYAQNIYLRIF